jgi:hypothetical protein
VHRCGSVPRETISQAHTHNKNHAKVVQKMLNVSHSKNRAKVCGEMLKNGKVATQQKPCHKMFANVKNALGNVK